MSLGSDDSKLQYQSDLTRKLADLVVQYDPDVVTLQETIKVARPGEARTSLVKVPDGYQYTEIDLIDSERHSYVAKWRKFEKQGKWPAGTYFGQG